MVDYLHLKEGKILWDGTKPYYCPECPCSPPPPATCAQCSAESSTMDAEFAGVVDNANCVTCDTGISHFNNTTFTLSGGGSGCSWASGIICSCALEVIFTAGRIVGFVTLAGGEIAEFEKNGSAPWDCTAEHILNFVDSTGAVCDFTGATLTINP